MEGPVTKAMIETGLIDSDTLGQLKAWGLMPQPIASPLKFDSPESMTQHIMEAVESEEAVATRFTDFEVLKQYLATKVKAKLHVPSPDDQEKTVGLSVYFGKTKTGSIILPYLQETIMDTLLDERTYLKPVGGNKLYFTDVNTLYYDEHPAFVVCEVVEDAK